MDFWGPQYAGLDGDLGGAHAASWGFASSMEADSPARPEDGPDGDLGGGFYAASSRISAWSLQDCVPKALLSFPKTFHEMF